MLIEPQQRLYKGSIIQAKIEIFILWKILLLLLWLMQNTGDFRFYR